MRTGQIIWTAAFLWLLSACSGAPYETLYQVASPDGRYIAKMELSEEGTLGSSHFRLMILKNGETGEREVFTGVNADADELKWRTSSELLVPFCFGEIVEIQSLVPNEGGDTISFRSRTSTSLRIDIITSRDTMIDGIIYCHSR